MASGTTSLMGVSDEVGPVQGEEDPTELRTGGGTTFEMQRLISVQYFQCLARMWEGLLAREDQKSESLKRRVEHASE